MGGRFLRSEDMDLAWRREAMEACGEERMVLNMIGIDGGWRIEARAKICERKKEGGGDLAADSLKNFASVLGKGLSAVTVFGFPPRLFLESDADWAKEPFHGK